MVWTNLTLVATYRRRDHLVLSKPSSKCARTKLHTWSRSPWHQTP